MLKQFRKYDAESEALLLDEQYLFAFTKSDGFTGRLLTGEFVVDWEYNYQLQLNAFQHANTTSNNSDTYFESGVLKGSELERFEQFLSLDMTAFRQVYGYEAFEVSDVGSQQLLVNFENRTRHIGILDELPLAYFNSDEEQSLYAYNAYLKTLIEEKYKAWAG